MAKKKNAPDRPQPTWLFPPDDENPVLNPKTKTPEEQETEQKAHDDAIGFLQRRAVGAPEKKAPPQLLLSLIATFLTEYGFHGTCRLFTTERKARSKIDGWENTLGKKLPKEMPRLIKIYNDWHRQWEAERADMTSSDDEDGDEDGEEGTKGKNADPKDTKAGKKEDDTDSSESESDSDLDSDSDVKRKKVTAKAKKSATKKPAPTLRSERSPSPHSKRRLRTNGDLLMPDAKPAQPTKKAEASSSDSSSSSADSDSTSSEEAAPKQKTKKSTEKNKPTLTEESATKKSRKTPSDPVTTQTLKTDARTNKTKKESKIAKKVQAPESAPRRKSDTTDSSATLEVDTQKPAAASPTSSSASDSESSNESDASTSTSSSSSASPEPTKKSTLKPTPDDTAKSIKRKRTASPAPAAPSKKPKSKASKSKSSITEPSTETPSVATTNPAAPTQESVTPKGTNSRFSRIPSTQSVDAKMSSNAYVPYEYADQAFKDLSVTKGKGFTKEKNKKKRGSYRGGAIDVEGRGGIKFE
ncbi:MAG: hypothetical protein M1817_005873 [Caeruleum heppii]|nr:MAG: hypothetical protein M1817_005873 [Caeruleum heppii]